MEPHKFVSTVNDFIRSHKLLVGSGRYLVALSGGADSVALLLLLCELHYQVEAVHCNFHLRGEESDRDERFCRQLCDTRHIPFHLIHFDTHAYAELHKVSIEMAARELRYRYFEQLRQDIGADDICVAHHRDDQVETVLINLVRGTGLHGLTGIAPRRGKIVRPLLCVGRADIEDWLRSRGQDFVTDSTNLVDDVTRNKFRLNIIPQLRAINPSVSESIAMTAIRLAEAERVFEQALAEGRKRVVELLSTAKTPKDSFAPFRISVEGLLREPSPEYLLFSILQPLGFTSSQVENVSACLSSETGREWRTATSQMLLDRGFLLVEPLERQVPRPMRIPEEGLYVISPEERLRIITKPCDDHFEVIRDKRVACLDASLVKFPLSVRRTENGDRFVPFGMKGSKLVSDYLTDRKFSLFDKRRQRVVTDADGKIVWLLAERPDNRFRITDKTTKCLILSLE